MGVKNNDYDDEKYNKVKMQQAQMKKYIATVFIIFVVAGLLFGRTNSSSSSSSSSSKATVSLRQSASVADTPVKETSGDKMKESYEKELVKEMEKLDSQVREIKKTGVIMETDEHSLKVTKQLQDITRELIKVRYGDYPDNPTPYRVKVELEFQETIPDFETNGKDGTLVIEMAPIQYIPVSVYTFLEVARSWIDGEFHRNAGHVLQARTNAAAIKKHLPFQEYSDQFPHKKGTTGYCGRPSGPCWYISIMDNTRNHGPGSQQQKNPYEADANFGRIIEGMDDVVPRIHTTPQREWLDKQNTILIRKMTILVPDGPDGSYIPWEPAPNSLLATTS